MCVCLLSRLFLLVYEFRFIKRVTKRDWFGYRLRAVGVTTLSPRVHVHGEPAVPGGRHLRHRHLLDAMGAVRALLTCILPVIPFDLYVCSTYLFRSVIMFLEPNWYDILFGWVGACIGWTSIALAVTSTMVYTAGLACDAYSLFGSSLSDIHASLTAIQVWQSCSFAYQGTCDFVHAAYCCFVARVLED